MKQIWTFVIDPLPSFRHVDFPGRTWFFYQRGNHVVSQCVEMSFKHFQCTKAPVTCNCYANKSGAPKKKQLVQLAFDKEHGHPPGLLLVPVPVLLAAHISPPVRLADLFITMMPPNFYPSELRLFYFFEIQES